MKRLPKRPRTFGRKKAKPYPQNKQYTQIIYPVITNVILDTSEAIGHVEKLEYIQDVNLTFDFQFDNNNCIVGAVFRACNDVFALTISQNKVIIANHAIIIDEPIELCEDEEYRCECGVKMNYTFSDFILYVRIWQEEQA